MPIVPPRAIALGPGRATVESTAGGGRGLAPSGYSRTARSPVRCDGWHRAHRARRRSTRGSAVSRPAARPAARPVRPALLVCLAIAALVGAPGTALASRVAQPMAAAAAPAADFPAGWEGFHTYAEVAADSLAVANAHPGIVKRF